MIELKMIQQFGNEMGCAIRCKRLVNKSFCSQIIFLLIFHQFNGQINIMRAHYPGWSTSKEV